MSRGREKLDEDQMKTLQMLLQDNQQLNFGPVPGPRAAGVGIRMRMPGQSGSGGGVRVVRLQGQVVQNRAPGSGWLPQTAPTPLLGNPQQPLLVRPPQQQASNQGHFPNQQIFVPPAPTGSSPQLRQWKPFWWNQAGQQQQRPSGTGIATGTDTGNVSAVSGQAPRSTFRKVYAMQRNGGLVPVTLPPGYTGKMVPISQVLLPPAVFAAKGNMAMATAVSGSPTQKPVAKTGTRAAAPPKPKPRAKARKQQFSNGSDSPASTSTSSSSLYDNGEGAQGQEIDLSFLEHLKPGIKIKQEPRDHEETGKSCDHDRHDRGGLDWIKVEKLEPVWPEPEPPRKRYRPQSLRDVEKTCRNCGRFPVDRRHQKSFTGLYVKYKPHQKAKRHVGVGKGEDGKLQLPCPYSDQF